MPLGDGVRRNAATVSVEERERLRNAFVALDSIPYPDGVSHWDKQNQIHQATHVHGGPSFLSWHREICNRLEDLLRAVDPTLSLHYWDWTTDPRNTTGGLNLFTPAFMGNSSGNVGTPFQNFETTEGDQNDPGTIHTLIWRNVNAGNPGAPAVSSDNALVTTGNTGANASQFPAFRLAVEGAHNGIHGYLGGTVGGDAHFAFHDPFVFMLHSNVDRLSARWQTEPGRSWRLDPGQVYGSEGNHARISENLEPWAGNSGLRPWAPPDNQQVVKNSRHASVVIPPRYDTNGQVEQAGWRWCRKCQGLAFAGGAPGPCPAGGNHDHAGSGLYSLFHNAAGAPGQSNWRWCRKCQGLAFGGGAPGTCAAGGTHDHSGSGNYGLAHNASVAFGQANWRWCKKCQGLAFAGGAPGPCPSGGNHDHAGSGNYALVHNAPVATGQANWRWCKKCQGLAFAGGAPGPCPSGGNHDHSGSGNYSLWQ
jgi:hypothetical protein